MSTAPEIEYIQDVENGFVYCVKCGEKVEDCKCGAAAADGRHNQ